MSEYQYNLHSDWSIPPDGDYISESQEIHHYDQVYLRTDTICDKNWEVVGSHNEIVKGEDCNTESVYVDTNTFCYDDGTCDVIDNYKDVTTCVPTTDIVPIDDWDWVEHCEDEKIFLPVPNYQTMYKYNIWEWVSINPLESTGVDNNIVCPAVTETETLRQSGNQEIHCKTEFLTDKRIYSYFPDCTTEFPMYKNGSEWNLTLSGSSIKLIEPLQ